MDQARDDQLNELSVLLNCADIEELLDVAIEKIPNMVVARLVSIFLQNEKETHLILRRHNHNKNITSEIPLDDKGSLVLEVYRRKQPILIHDIHSYIKEYNLPIEVNKRQKYTSSSCMLIPITVKHPKKGVKIIGVLNIADKSDFTVFSKEDLRFASQIGEILGAGVHNILIIEKKLGGRQKELMADLQKMKTAIEKKQAMDISLEEARKKVNQILPDLPNIEHYDIYCHYSPMETIGGDLYDFIKINEKDLGVVIGDVSGHGIEAALVMSMTKQVLNIYSKIYSNLKEVLNRANDEIFSSLQGSSFISAFFGILDTQTHILRYARAGHNPPILYNSSRNPCIQELDSKGMVLGTARSNSFIQKLEETSIQLNPNDIILFYTDGVVEAPNKEGQEFTPNRLKESLIAHASKSAKDLTAAIKEDVLQFMETEEQSDDITLLCVKVCDITVPEKHDEVNSIYDSGVFIIPQHFGKPPVTEELYLQPDSPTSIEITPEPNIEVKITPDSHCVIEDISKKIVAEQIPYQPVYEVSPSEDYNDSGTGTLAERDYKLLKDFLNFLKTCDYIKLFQERNILEFMKRIEILENKIKSAEATISSLSTEREKIKKQLQEAHKEIEDLQKKLSDWAAKEEMESAALRHHLLTGPVKFKDKVVAMIESENYDEALNYLERLLTIAMDRGNVGEMTELMEQLLFLARALPSSIVGNQQLK